MSAVSRNVTPSSIAASITARVPARSTRRPKLLQPSPTTEASSPESPSGRVFICVVSLMASTLEAVSRPVLTPSRLQGIGEAPRDRSILALLPQRDHDELVTVGPADVDEPAVVEVPHEHGAALAGGHGTGGVGAGHATGDLGLRLEGA